MSQRGGGMGGESERPSVRGGKEGGRKAVSGEAQVNVAQIQTYLKGIDYPADSRKLVQKAHDNGAPQDVITVLEQMPKNKQFHSAADVSQALGEIM